MVADWSSWFGGFWIFPLLCLLFMAAMGVVMFRFGGCCMPMGRRGGDASSEDRETPQQILDRRFAKGELTREQWETMRRDLETPAGVR